MIYDVAIVGGGVIGGMVARELTKYNLSLCILEKENDVACGASKANSGIVHGGYDPEPDTLKAKMNTLGVEKLFATAKQLHVPILRNGSMVCAFSAEEDKTVQELYERGLKNNIPNMKTLTGDEAREIEPNLSGEIASVLWVRNAGIVCPYDLTIAAVGNAMDNGAKLFLNFALAKVEKENGLFQVTSANGETVTANYLINCAGCGSDKVAKLCGDDSFTIIPRGGEYLLLDKTEGQRVSHTIFQCPSKEGKGILVSPTVDGNLLTGPTAGVVADPEEKAITQAGIDMVTKLSAKSVPSVQLRNVITSFTGVRSSEKNGDFIIGFSEKCENLLNVAAIDSPGLTACVAIAEYVAELLKNAGVELSENKTFNGNRENPHAFRSMTDEEKDAYIKQHPEYGKIVCRCEGVSEGEIRYALRTNPPARDMDGVKRRTRSGMGRCQGGFCGPYVMKLIAEELGIAKEEVTKNGAGSHMVIGKL
ncbi:MAG: NAD(P)/FAD-dependent oxidoreductase [Oscillospiraceae bacterium]|nr:NAD(P)/FAD-dependent oxidoreductase [Oscillospiraceae bacterium]